MERGKFRDQSSEIRVQRSELRDQSYGVESEGLHRFAKGFRPFRALLTGWVVLGCQKVLLRRMTGLGFGGASATLIGLMGKQHGSGSCKGILRFGSAAILRLFCHQCGPEGLLENQSTTKRSS